MKHYKKDGQVFAFDETQSDLITGDMVLMTDAEVEAHTNPPLTQEQLDGIAFTEWKAEQSAIKEAELRAEFNLTRV